MNFLAEWQEQQKKQKDAERYRMLRATSFMHKHRGAQDINSLYQQQQKLKRKAEREKIKQEALALHNYRGGEHDIKHEIDLKHQRDAERERQKRAASFIRKYRGGKNDFGHKYSSWRASKKTALLHFEDDNIYRETEQMGRDINDAVSFFENQTSSLTPPGNGPSKVALIEPEFLDERNDSYRYSRASVAGSAMFSIIEDDTMDDVSVDSLADIEQGQSLSIEMNYDDSNSCDDGEVQGDHPSSTFGYFDWTNVPSENESSDSDSTALDNSSHQIPVEDTRDFLTGQKYQAIQRANLSRAMARKDSTATRRKLL